MKVFRAIAVLLFAVPLACGGNSAPSSPTPTSSSITAPTPDSPADGAASTTYRPTLVVRNGTSSLPGARLYEFVISDSSGFSTTSATSGAFVVYAHTTNVAEGSGGSTSYTPDFDLQPTTRLYWRARLVIGTSASEWTATRSLTTPIAGYSRAGELYDPLIYGSTVGVPMGSTTFVPGKGIQLNDGNAYVRYQLAQTLDSGEFSMEVEGLHANGPGAKLKVFSMMDGTGDLYRSQYLLNAQYRGVNGNPDNCIAFKALFGDPFFKLEPDAGTRGRAIMALDPSKAYFWKGTWSNEFRLVIQDGINGPTLYNVGVSIADLGTTLRAIYNPSPHYAYLGANNGPFGEEDGSWAGAIYRNVWIGRGPRPASLGSALLPPQ
ncbi:MAG TPA: hypothetical protein VF921_14060 [Vicinamibacterales bacterium]